jgi:hypothetical protein
MLRAETRERIVVVTLKTSLVIQQIIGWKKAKQIRRHTVETHYPLIRLLVIFLSQRLNSD